MVRFLAALLACLALAACGTGAHGTDHSDASDRHQGSGDRSTDRGAQGDKGDRERFDGTVTVLAAASLTESFEEIANRFEQRYPGVTVRTSFGASSSLVHQIRSGASADIFASASPEEFRGLPTAGDPRVIVRNRLQLAVPPSNPGDVRELSDLTRSDLRVAFCAPEVPCGDAAEEALQAAGEQVTPDTLGNDVKKVATLVRLGEVDAGLIYRTDVVAGGDAIQGIDLPRRVAAPRNYPAAVLPDAPNPQAARAFLNYLESSEARQIFRDAGFEPA